MLMDIGPESLVLIDSLFLFWNVFLHEFYLNCEILMAHKSRATSTSGTHLKSLEMFFCIE